MKKIHGMGSSYGWLGGLAAGMSGCIDFLQSIGGTKQEATALLKDTRQWVRKRYQGKKRGVRFFCFVLQFFPIGRMNDLWDFLWCISVSLAYFHPLFADHLHPESRRDSSPKGVWPRRSSHQSLSWSMEVGFQTIQKGSPTQPTKTHE